LVLHGEKDFLIPVKQATLLGDSLEVAKKHYRFILYPNSGHRLPPEDVRVKSPPFSKKTPARPAVPLLLNFLQKLLTLLALSNPINSPIHTSFS
jgi:Prolyl oligopeptidase family